MSYKTPHHLQHPDREARAIFAKNTISKVIPDILQRFPKAKAGTESTERIYYSPETANDRPERAKTSRKKDPEKKRSELGKITGHFKPLSPRKPVTLSQSESNGKAASTTIQDEKVEESLLSHDEDDNRKPVHLSMAHTRQQPDISVVQSDTLDAALSFVDVRKDSKVRIAVLNMASFLRPGGGVLNGAIAQEESLCLRSTLYTALDEKFYRLPKFGGLFTKDVLVFRDSSDQDLQTQDWYYIDVISVAALKRPDLIKTSDGKEVYEYEQDEEEMMSKIKLILRTALLKKTSHLILGAFGCGAYHNPPEEVAKMFRRVIFGNGKGQWAMDLTGIQKIVFAIFDDGVNLKVFKELLVESQPQSSAAWQSVYGSDNLRKDVGREDIEMGNA